MINIEEEAEAAIERMGGEMWNAQGQSLWNMPTKIQSFCFLVPRDFSECSEFWMWPLMGIK